MREREFPGRHAVMYFIDLASPVSTATPTGRAAHGLAQGSINASIIKSWDAIK